MSALDIVEELKPMLEHLGLEPWPDGRSIADGKRPVEQHIMMIVSSLKAQRDSLKLELREAKTILEQFLERCPLPVRANELAETVFNAGSFLDFLEEEKLPEKPKDAKCLICDLPVNSQAHLEECAAKRKQEPQKIEHCRGERCNGHEVQCVCPCVNCLAIVNF